MGRECAADAAAHGGERGAAAGFQEAGVAAAASGTVPSAACPGPGCPGASPGQLTGSRGSHDGDKLPLVTLPTPAYLKQSTNRAPLKHPVYTIQKRSGKRGAVTICMTCLKFGSNSNFGFIFGQVCERLPLVEMSWQAPRPVQEDRRVAEQPEASSSGQSGATGRQRYVLEVAVRAARGPRGAAGKAYAPLFPKVGSLPKI